MPARNRLTVIALAAIIIGSAVLASYFKTTSTEREETSVYPRLPHSPVSIDEARDFTPVNSSTGCACVVAGSGSGLDPYIIAGWSINASETDGISVTSVEEHFTITQVTISDSAKRNVGIRLERVQNSKVSNSTISGTYTAIYAQISREITIVDNTIGNSEYGIWLEASDSNTVSRNNLDVVAQVPIFVRGSENLIEENSIEEGYGGINIDGTVGHAEGNLVRNNRIEHTLAYGIGLWQADNNSIVGNTVVNGMGPGIVLTESSHDNAVESNEVKQNAGDGIVIFGQSSRNLVQKNIVTGNGDGVQSFDLHSTEPDNIWRDNTFKTKEPDSLE
jgi:parallel beta-helix repeat protein